MLCGSPAHHTPDADDRTDGLGSPERGSCGWGKGAGVGVHCVVWLSSGFTLISLDGGLRGNQNALQLMSEGRY
jgi:hypothetical protein